MPTVPTVDTVSKVSTVSAVYSAVLPQPLMVFFHFKYVLLGTGCHPQKPENRDEQSHKSWGEEGKEKYQLRGDFARFTKKFLPLTYLQVIMEDIDKQKKKEKNTGVVER